MSNIIVAIVGSSGSGKSYLQEQLINLDKTRYKKIISCTTRKRRDGEIDGKDYHFLSIEEFNASVFAIKEEVFKGVLYGVTEDELKLNNKIGVFVIDPNGCFKLKKWAKKNKKKLFVVYLDIPKKKRIENMLKRGDDLDSIKARLAKDTILKDWNKLKKENKLKAHIIIKKNGKFNSDAKKIDSFIRTNKTIIDI